MTNTRAIIPSDRARLDVIKTKARKARMSKGRLILGVETVTRTHNVPAWMVDMAYQTQVVVGRPAKVSPWLNHPEAIRQFGQECRAQGIKGITRIADAAPQAIKTAKECPGERVMLAFVGDCFEEESVEELRAFAPQLVNHNVQVIMGQDAVCEKGEAVYKEFALLTDGTYIEPFQMNDPQEIEKVMAKIKAAPRRIENAGTQ
jgi:hypothetical protein